jgi:hypothetical protein
MTSDKDLEKVLQENLKLRRELVAAAKTEAASQNTGLTSRLVGVRGGL